MNVIERKVYSPSELAERLGPIIELIRSVYEPEQIVLFGSAAQGKPWHDLDLLVIAETEDRFFDRLKKIAIARSKGTWTPTDILVLTPAEVAENVREDRLFVVDEILAKGKTIYERGGRRHLDALRSR